MKRKIVAILIVSILFSLLAMNVTSATLGVIGNINAVVPTSPIQANPGTTVSPFVVLRLDQNYDYTTDDGNIVVSVMLYESDQSTALTESGWKLNSKSSMFMSPWVDEGTDSSASDGRYYLTYKIDADEVAKKGATYTYRTLSIQAHVTSPSTTTKSSVYVGIRLDEEVSGDEQWYGTYWWKIILRTTPVTYYNIDLSATALPNKIEPEETITRKLTVYNNGSQILPVAIYYQPKLKDSNGNNVELEDWKVYVFDAVRADVYYLTVPASSSSICYLEITAPERDKAPPDCTFYVYLDAKVLNDTAYGESVTLSTETSSEFTGDGDNIWSSLGTSNWLYSPLFWIIVIVIIVIAWLFYQNKIGGKRSKTNKR